MSGLSVAAAYAPVPAVGSLVYVPGTGRSSGGRSGPAVGCRGLIGVVTSWSRDVRSGRVVALNCRWFDLNFRPVFSDSVGPRAVLPWSPGVSCATPCAAPVGWGVDCAACGYRR
jgi:hypothetical protein